MDDKLGYVDVYDHPLTLELRKNHSIILEEFKVLSNHFLGIKPNNSMGSVVNQKSSNGKELYQGKINSVFTHVAADSCSKPEYEAVWGITEESHRIAEEKFLLKRKLTPVLESILQPYKKYLGCVGFNLMYPPANLSMHYGMVSKYIRFHLGLICDPEAKFHVNEYPPRAWETGKVWAFDDGDAFHGTTHDGENLRVILIVDIDRAGLGSLEEEKRWG